MSTRFLEELAYSWIMIGDEVVNAVTGDLEVIGNKYENPDYIKEGKI